ncbi:glutamate--tRNA ligase, partial [bacterium]|nr:glutamate--tRNA ligase [bacterium]
TPSYNFAVVVDDSMMAITHVIRGEDHISNTPKQILLFEALGAAVPRFAHLPMILGPDKSKLSKRHGATGVTEYRNQGYMADAMFNYLTLLGWSSPSGTEILSREEITPQFALDRVSKSGAVFDITKLNWMNGQYIRRQTPESLWRLTQPFISSEMTARLSGYSDEQKQAIVMSVRDNLDLLTDIDRFIQVYGWTESEFQDQIKSGQALGTGDRTVLAAFRGAIEEIEWSPATIDQAVLDVVTATGLGKGKVFKPIRLGVSAAGSGPHLGDLIYLLGRERVMGRLDFVLETLGVKE